MLLQRANKVFASPDWVYEPKWDGFRVLASVRDGAVRLIWRNGASFTNLFGPITDALRGFPTSVVLDGEVICINDKGQPDFEALRGRGCFAKGQTSEEEGRKEAPGQEVLTRSAALILTPGELKK